jgi:CheY-like chemotaxis protein
MDGMTALVADDSRVFRVLVGEVLKEQGIVVSEAGNGREALDRAVTERPRLLVLDALMPGLSGFDVVKELRQRTPDYRPVIFMVTGVYKSRRWASEARHLYEVDEYLEKPLEPETLLAALNRHFGDTTPRPDGVG